MKSTMTLTPSTPDVRLKQTSTLTSVCLLVNFMTGTVVLSVGLMVFLTAMSAFFSSSDIVTSCSE